MHKIHNDGPRSYCKGLRNRKTYVNVNVKAYTKMHKIHCVQKKQPLLFSCITLNKSNQFE